MANNLIRGDELFSEWRRDLLSGEPPIRFQLADGGAALGSIMAEPGRVTVLGGSPGSGKTALIMQLVIDGLRLADDLRVLVANVEMPPAVLLNRQLARLSGIDLTIIQDRTFTDTTHEQLEAGLGELKTICERLGFVRGPFTMQNVAAAADELEPDILVLDYLQRFTSSASGDRRGGLDQSMSFIRQFADAGACVFLASALARQKDAAGRATFSKSAMTLSAFRDSSEIEFGVDDAYILTAGKDPTQRTLLHLKSRNGQCRDIELDFDGAVQQFSAALPVDGAAAAAWWAP